MESTHTEPSSGFRHGARRSATVMIADVVGYSRRLEQDEEHNLPQVVRSFELFKSLSREYGGEVVNVSGDGILALFGEKEKAVGFAVQIQKEFRDHAVWSSGDPIEVRIGIALGDVVENFGTFQGHCINVAARLQTMAEPGGVLVTRAVADSVASTLGVSLRSLGRPTLKNLARQFEVFAVEAAAGPQRRVQMGREKPVLEPAGQPSVAVLPLTNLSTQPALDHVAEGIGGSVIDNLSRFRNLVVIAQHSSFLFSLGTSSASEIGDRLGARYLLCGSLHADGQRLRIAVELIHAESEAVLWRDTSRVGMDQLFELQEEIAGAVASRLAQQIDLAQLRGEDIQNPHDTRAYGLVLRGRQLVEAYRKEKNAHARRLFEEALQIAPTYGRAYSSLSRTHNLDWRYGWSDTPEASLDAALDYAGRAILHDPLDARGYAERGFAELYRKRHDQSLAHYTRALALNPNDADIIAEYADAHVYADRPDRALELMEKAMRLNPYYPDWYLWYLGDAYNALGRPEDVIATVLRMQDPGEGSRLLAANYAHLDRMDEARAAAAEVLRLHPNFTLSEWRHRPPYRDKAIIDHYVAGLQKAGLPG